MSTIQSERNIERECLIAKYHPRRVSAVLYYVFGAVLFLFGFVFMILSSASYVESSIIAWYLGILSMIIGVSIITIAEIRRRYSLYIITTWNVRTRTGFWTKVTTRLFYDEIEKVEVDRDLEEVRVNQGDILIFAIGEADPVIRFDAIAYPLGAFEIIPFE